MAKRITDTFECLEVIAKRQFGLRRRGELFRMHTRQLGDMFGIVACENVVLRAMDGGKWAESDQMLLVYAYRHTVSDRNQLKIRNFAMKPKVMFGDGWTLGVFETLDHLRDDQYERLPVHCFGPLTEDDPPGRSYFDENGKWIPTPTKYTLNTGVCSVVFYDLIIQQYVDRERGGKGPYGPWF